MTSDKANHEIRGEDDHDLLTFDESGVRLRREIERTETALAGNPSPESRRSLESALAALTDALARTAQNAASNPGERGFLDYRPPPRKEQ